MRETATMKTKPTKAAFEEDRPAPRITTLPLAEITCDPEILPRAINFATVQDYRDDMARGDKFPPVEVVQDGATRWLVHGLQRFEAARLNGSQAILCAVRKGDKRSAILASVGVNADHGLRRTSADKRVAVGKLLNDPKWSRWSTREIARQCRVSTTLVIDMRAERAARAATVTNNSEKERHVVLYTNKHGTAAQMNVIAIGRPAPVPGPTPAQYLARERLHYFIETIHRLAAFRARCVFDEVDLPEAVQILLNLPTRDGLARIAEAVEFIQAALSEIGPHEVVPFNTREPDA
jgi:hypothetical protein